MKITILQLIVYTLFTPVFCCAQRSLSTDYFRSANSGDWKDVESWQSSQNNILFITATEVPTSNASNIIIQMGHTITISTAGISLIKTTVFKGGTLQITTPSYFTIGDGLGDDLVVENGGMLLLNFSTSTTPLAPAGNGTVLIKTGAAVIANAAVNSTVAKAIGDNYLAVNSKFTYADKAIFEWKISNQIFFETTGANQYFKTLSISDVPIFKVNTVLNIQFKSSAENKFNALLETYSSLIFSGTGAKIFRGGLSGTGFINQTGGAIILPNSTGILDGSITINIISRGLIFEKGAIIPVGANIKITSAVQDQNIHKISGNLQINGSLDVTDCTIDNAGATSVVTIAQGGLLKTNNKEGFTGTGATITSTTGSIILENNSTIEFNRMGDQNFKSRTDFKNLTFSGTGNKRPSGGFKSVGTIKITGSAILNCTNYNVGSDGVETNLTMDGGRLIVSTSGTQPTMKGVYLLTGGVVEFAGNNNMSIRSETYKNIEVTGSNINNSNSNIVLRDLGTFTIKNGGTFSINDNSIIGPIGTQTVTIENGGIFNCGNGKGFHGFTASFSENSSIHSNIENIVLLSGSTVVYSKNASQLISNSNQLIYQNLVIAGSIGTKTAPVDSLIIEGDFFKKDASIFAHNRGTVLFKNNYSDQKISSTGTTPIIYFNLINNNSFVGGTGLNIISNLDIENSFAVGANSKLFLLSGDIKLLSTAIHTAGIAEIPSSSTINYETNGGRFVVERYYPNNMATAPRAWRMVCVPLQQPDSIFNAWQLSGAGYGINNYHRGMLIAGPKNGTSGLDNLQTNSYSLKKYDGVNFVGVEDTHLQTSVGAGYLLFVRGDRNPNLSDPANNSYTTLSNRGKLQTDTTNIMVNSNFGLIGNPYASPVNFLTIDKINVNAHRFYIWDPKLNSVGGFVVMEDLTTPGIFKPTAPSGGSSQNNFIQSSQAFFVEKIGTSAASVTIKESDKTAEYNAATFRPYTVAEVENDFVKANLYLLNTDNSKVLADGNLAEFNDKYIEAVDLDDAIKLANTNESFALCRNVNKLAVERRSFIIETDTLFYRLTNTTQRNYHLDFDLNIANQALKAYWQDGYTKRNTLIKTIGTTGIDFEINNDALSAVEDRFRMVFIKTNSALPVNFKTLTATRKLKNIEIEWATENEVNIRNYQIEKSIDGIIFTKIAIIDRLAFCVTNFYKKIDNEPYDGFNYYRIRCNEEDGHYYLSNIIKLKYVNESSNIKVYPYGDDGIILKLNNIPKGAYQIRLINYQAQILYTNVLNHVGGNGAQILRFKQALLLKGNYLIEVIHPNKIKQIISIFL